MTMTASFLGGAAVPKNLPVAGAANRRGMLVVKASKVDVGEKINMVEDEGSSNGRREMVFAAAAAAVCSLAKIAMADEEPKAGTPDARKKYAPICVTMPTAKICHK